MADTAFVLIVEDEPEHAEAMAEALKRVGHACRSVSTAEEAFVSLKTRPPDVVVTDYKLGGEKDGIDVLRAAKQIAPGVEVVLVTAYGDEKLCRNALKQEGAWDYIVKPIDVDLLRTVVNRAARHAMASRRDLAIQKQRDQMFSFEGIIGTNPKMKRLLDVVRRVADTKLTVMITGESGTGKELIAQAIHNNSSRRANILVPINCAALSETLLESELFGHVKGAYTGAVGDRKGKFEYADGGTLFLDEIGDMPLAMQAKLLRVLENGEVVRVGSNEAIKVDVRFLAASNRDLHAAIERKEFREDLFYRISNVSLHIPPLRERREDIPLLIEHYLQRANVENDLHIEGIDPEAMRLLTNYAWPGNVRELAGVVNSMAVMAQHPILLVEDVPDTVKGPTDLVPASRARSAVMKLTDMERELIRRALDAAEGNRERAAEMLGIPTRTLYRRLQKYGLG